MSYGYNYNTQINDLSAFDAYIGNEFSTYLYSVYYTVTPSVSVTFSAQLSSNELTHLQTLIDSYPNPSQTVPFYYKCSGMDAKSTGSQTWHTVMTSAYQGQVAIAGVLVSILISCMLLPNDPDDSSSPDFYYDIRLIDVGNNDHVLASGTYSNSTQQVVELPVANAPIHPSGFKLQVRKGPAGSQVYVETYCGKYEV